MLAVEEIEGSVSVSGVFKPTSNTFALTVSGDSMRGAGILDGDYVVVEKGGDVKDGDIAVVQVGDEATVKRVIFGESQITLQPENPEYDAIQVKRLDPDVHICGPVRGVVRTI